MKAHVQGARIIIIAETKQDLTDLMRAIKHYPECDQKYWLVLDCSKVDRSCDIRKLPEPLNDPS